MQDLNTPWAKGPANLFNRFAHSAGPGPWVEGPWRRSLQRGKVNNMVATSLQNGSKIVPKWHQHGCQMGSGSPLEASWESLGALKRLGRRRGGLPGAYGARLDASWDALGAEKSSLERLLAAPRGIPREVSAILGVKRLPKGCPKGAQNEVQKRLELKTAKSQKSTTVHRICLIFEVPGLPFAPKSGSKTGSES